MCVCQSVRHGDDCAVDVLVVQHSPELRSSPRSLLLGFLQFRIHLVENGLIEIAERLDFAAAPDGTQGVAAALVAPANQGEHHFLVCTFGTRIQIQK